MAPPPPLRALALQARYSNGTLPPRPFKESISPSIEVPMHAPAMVFPIPPNRLHQSKYRCTHQRWWFQFRRTATDSYVASPNHRLDECDHQSPPARPLPCVVNGRVARQIFRKGYAKRDRRELKQRLMNSFFFGSVKGSGEPIYYNNFALSDPNHEDLVPGRSVIKSTRLVHSQSVYRSSKQFVQACCGF